jgi:hypothetical protein
MIVAATAPQSNLRGTLADVELRLSDTQQWAIACVDSQRVELVNPDLDELLSIVDRARETAGTWRRRFHLHLLRKKPRGGVRARKYTIGLGRRSSPAPRLQASRGSS